MAQTYYVDIDDIDKPDAKVYVNPRDDRTNLDELKDVKTGEVYNKRGRGRRAGGSSPQPTQEQSIAPQPSPIVEQLTAPQPTIQELMNKGKKEYDKSNIPNVSIKEESPNRVGGINVTDHVYLERKKPIEQVYYTEDEKFSPDVNEATAVIVYKDKSGKLTGKTSNPLIDLSSLKGQRVDEQVLAKYIKDAEIVSATSGEGSLKYEVGVDSDTYKTSIPVAKTTKTTNVIEQEALKTEKIKVNTSGTGIYNPVTKRYDSQTMNINPNIRVENAPFVKTVISAPSFAMKKVDEVASFTGEQYGTLTDWIGAKYGLKKTKTVNAEEIKGVAPYQTRGTAIYNPETKTYEANEQVIITGKDELNRFMQGKQRTVEVDTAFGTARKVIPKAISSEVNLAFYAGAGGTVPRLLNAAFIVNAAKAGIELVSQKDIMTGRSFEDSSGNLGRVIEVGIGAAALTGVIGSMTAKNVKKVRVGQEIRKTVRDEQGNVFIITKKQTAPEIKQSFVGREILIGDKQYLQVNAKAVENIPKQYANVGYKNPIMNYLFSPEQKVVRAPQTFTAKPEVFLINQEGIMQPVEVKVQRQNANLFKQYQMSGGQVAFTGEEFKTLPKEVQKQILKQGKGVVAFEDGSVYSFGGSESTLLYRGSDKIIKGRKEYFVPSDFGKRTVVSSDTSALKKVIETDEYIRFKGRVGSTDISQPTGYVKPPSDVVSIKEFVKNIGKTKDNIKVGKISNSDVEGIILKNSNSFDDINTASDFYIKTAAKKVTAKQFKTLGSSLEIVEKTLPKPTFNYPKISKSAVDKIVMNNQVDAPLIVGGTGSTSLFYAKGRVDSNYNENQGKLSVAIPENDVSILPKFMINVKENDNIADFATLLPEVKPDIKIKDIIDKRSGNRNDNISNNDTVLKYDERTRQDVAEAQAVAQKSKQNIIAKIKNKLKSGTPFLFYTKIKVSTPNIKSNNMKKPKLSDNVRKAFDLIVFNKGKEQVIARKLPENRAKLLGVKNVISNLRASFKLKPSGTTTEEDIEYKIPTNQFRLSKVDKSRYVQRLNTRFGSSGETSEAQFFRGKVKKVKWI